MTNFERTAVLITGGNERLGHEAARRLGEHGWTIFLGSRNEGRGQKAADTLAAGGAKVVMVPLAYSWSKTALNMITGRYAQALPEIKFNIVTPGETANRRYAATDMNHHTGAMTVAEGTDSFIRLAMIDADGPTGTFTDRFGPVAWCAR